MAVLAGSRWPPSAGARAGLSFLLGIGSLLPAPHTQPRFRTSVADVRISCSGQQEQSVAVGVVPVVSSGNSRTPRFRRAGPAHTATPPACSSSWATSTDLLAGPGAGSSAAHPRQAPKQRVRLPGEPHPSCCVVVCPSWNPVLGFPCGPLQTRSFVGNNGHPRCQGRGRRPDPDPSSGKTEALWF